MVHTESLILDHCLIKQTSQEQQGLEIKQSNQPKGGPKSQKLKKKKKVRNSQIHRVSGPEVALGNLSTGPRIQLK